MVDVYLRGEQRLYKMLFASDHQAGKAISDWISVHSSAQTQGESLDRAALRELLRA